MCGTSGTRIADNHTYAFYAATPFHKIRSENIWPVTVWPTFNVSTVVSARRKWIELSRTLRTCIRIGSCLLEPDIIGPKWRRWRWAVHYNFQSSSSMNSNWINNTLLYTFSSLVAATPPLFWAWEKILTRRSFDFGWHQTTYGPYRVSCKPIINDRVSISSSCTMIFENRMPYTRETMKIFRCSNVYESWRQSMKMHSNLTFIHH